MEKAERGCALRVEPARGRAARGDFEGEGLPCATLSFGFKVEFARGVEGRRDAEA
jgi:hypothetical protein